jgi:undecaprenyl-diphosphatase
MDLIVAALVLGVIQGVSEWLPISSKTMILLVSMALLGTNTSTGYTLGLLLQSGTVGASVIFFRAQILQMLKCTPMLLKDLAHLNFCFTDVNEKILWNMVLATTCTGILGIPLYVFFRFSFSTVNALQAMIALGLLLITSGVLVTLSRRRMGQKPIADATGKNAVLTGFAQGFSILPGVSRSGMTTSSLLWQNFRKEDAFVFSFIMGIPASIGASIISVSEGSFEFQQLGTIPILIAFLASFIVGVLTIRLMLEFAKRFNFAVLTIFLGSVSVLLSGYVLVFLFH